MSRLDIRSRPNSTRPQSASDQLVEIHVYVVPRGLWREHYNNVLNQSVTETVSLGIVRVPPEIRLIELRDELLAQLDDQIPPEYVYLKSVGRCLTKLKTKQEYTIKIKHFLKPVSYAPELYLLEGAPGDFVSMAGEDSRSQSSFQQGDVSGRSTYRGYPNYNDVKDPDNKTYREKNENDVYNNRNHNASADELQSEQSSRRTQRSGHRAASPTRRYTPIPKLDTYSPTAPQSPQQTARVQQYRSNTPPSPKRRNEPNYYKGQYDNDEHNDPDTDYAFNEPESSNTKSDRQQEYNQTHDDQHEKISNEQTYDNQHEKISHEQTYDNRRDKTSRDRDAINNRYVGDERDWESVNRKDRSDDYRDVHSVQKDDSMDAIHRESPDVDIKAYQVLPAINKTPPRSAARGKGHADARGRVDRSAADSGNGRSEISPEDHDKTRNNYRDDMERQRKEYGNRLAMDGLDIYDDSTYRLEDIDEWDRIDQERWQNDEKYRQQLIDEERKRREEDRRRQEEENEDRRRQEEERKRNDERRNGKTEEDNKINDEKIRRESEEELERYPSPPELNMGTSRDTESAKGRASEEKERLLDELEAAKQGRKGTEKVREELVRKAKQLQSRTTNRRNQARDIWKKKYFEEKKRTAPLEEQVNRRRQELDNIHRKLMSTLEGPREKNIRLIDGKPSPKNNYVIQCTRLQHEIDDLQRRVENAKMKLTAEMKLRTQADAEMRLVRAEALDAKIKHRGHAFSQIY